MTEQDRKTAYPVGPESQPTPGPEVDDECFSCGEDMPRAECPKGQRPCGHHCNHSWTHDACHWCGREFGEEE